MFHDVISMRHAHADDVVKHESAIAVHGVDDLAGGPQARDDDRHLVPHTHLHVCHQARIALMHDLIHSERRDRLVGVRVLMGSQCILDVLYPAVEGLLRTRIERRECTDNAGLALFNDETRMRHDVHRRADQWQTQPAFEH